MWRVRSIILLEKPHSLCGLLRIPHCSLRSLVPVEPPDFTAFFVLSPFLYSVMELYNFVLRCRTKSDNFFRTYYTVRGVQDTSPLTLFVHRRTSIERLTNDY